MKNKKTMYIIFVLAIIVFGFMFFSSDKKDLTVQPGEKELINNDGNEKNIQTNVIQTKVGEEFIIELDSNPSTGYSWVSDFDKETVAFVEKLNKQTLPHPVEGSEIVGASIQEVFKFKALKTGETKISFYYLREWEIDVAPIDQKVFDVTIR